jgi:hypothetical protein
MYLWTATIAFPVTVLAFAPIWVAALVALALFIFTTIFSLGKSKMYPQGKQDMGKPDPGKPETESVNS